MVSRIVSFSGVPEICRNFARPDCFVMSTNTTGAPFTKPPAVMGRESASLTAGLGAPVADPVAPCACASLPLESLGGSCPNEAFVFSQKAEISQKQANAQHIRGEKRVNQAQDFMSRDYS